MSIKPGYPKLAIYNPPKEDYKLPFYRIKNKLNLPKSARSVYNFFYYELTPNELIILVADCIRFKSNYYLGTRDEYINYYVVPFNAIEKGLIPKTSAYNWRSSYTILPLMAAEELIIVNKDELERQMKHENKYSVQSK